MNIEQLIKAEILKIYPGYSKEEIALDILINKLPLLKCIEQIAETNTKMPLTEEFVRSYAHTILYLSKHGFTLEMAKCDED